jgi:soluble lytic murein transglycosylase
MAAFEWADHYGYSDFRPAHLLDARTNVLAGTFYLSKLVQRYLTQDRPLVYALADYNAGRKQVLVWMAESGATNSQVFLQQMDYPGTKSYIQSILGFRDDFQTDFNEGPPRPLEQGLSSDSLASLNDSANRPEGAEVSAE